jgi:hypothetical protein
MYIENLLGKNMNFALLPEGVVISHPHLVKLIKIVPNNNIRGRSLYVVVARLYDTSEIMIKNCSSLKEAQALVKRCTKSINLAIANQDVDEILSQSESLSQEHYEEYTTTFQTQTLESQNSTETFAEQNQPTMKEEDSDEWPVDDGSNDWE